MLLALAKILFFLLGFLLVLDSLEIISKALGDSGNILLLDPFSAFILTFRCSQSIDSNKKPVYVGNVGTGFDQALLESLLEKLKKIVVSEAPFECEPYKGKVTWVEPKLVCEVVYMAVSRI